ncbi:MAG: glycine cleavage system protein R [Nitrospinales bacterium]
MKQWYMLTLVGKDRPGIVAQLTGALFQAGCNLGEASMTRLGGNFTVMLMVEREETGKDVNIRVYGAYMAGIVAKVTGALAEKGLNIVNLESTVGGTSEKPIYIMDIEGVAAKGISVLETALESLQQEEGLEVKITPIDTLIG